jgi:Skp family chaperone for outer membrane proteins
MELACANIGIKMLSGDELAEVLGAMSSRCFWDAAKCSRYYSAISKEDYEEIKKERDELRTKIESLTTSTESGQKRKRDETSELKLDEPDPKLKK